MGCVKSKPLNSIVVDPTEKRPAKPAQTPEHRDSLPGKPNNKEDVQLGNSNIFTPKQSTTPVSSWKGIPTGTEDTCCYFFGIDQDNIKKIFKFDPRTDVFTYLEIPSPLQVFNMSACVYLSETTIYLTGGTDSQATKVVNKAYKYNPANNSSEELPSFGVERYAHQAAFLQDKLYVIGGLGLDKASADGNEEAENVLRSVEQYNTKTKTWNRIADLNFGRSLAQALVYQDTLYVLNGYVGNTKRTSKIERLNIQRNSWEVLDLQLPCSLEASYIFSPGPDQIQVLGGQNSVGEVNKNYVYNLKDNTFKQMKAMNHERVLHKGYSSKDKVIIFGGDADNTIEEYNIHDDEWLKQPSSNRSILSGIKPFSYAQPTLHVSTNSEAKPEEILTAAEKKSKKCFIFGDDEVNFILEVNFTKTTITEKIIPSGLKLRGYQGIVALPNGSYFLCGGKNKSNVKVSQKAYLYNPTFNQVKKLPSLADARYTFNIIYLGECVYIIGGRRWGEDDDAILGSCERYNLLANKWEKVANLNCPRCSSMAFQLKNKIYVLGGYKGDSQRWSEIEVYYPEKNIWEVYKTQLKVALEGSSIVLANKRGGIFLLGGRTDDGDTDKVWDFDVEQGDMWEVGNLKEAKSLNKVFEFNERKAFIFGGEKCMVELFDLTESKPIQEDEFSLKIQNSLLREISKGRVSQNKILRFGLA